ncbi:hypothetical protein Vretimale_16175 [Volvox reticuliferus]|uniref:Uncharacterized protein n=1 Tax=Volvox reticuliferus TaxID=1737510 RepID=A0A8J4GSA1_9CHLO|nr:hypothetical protein Vretifemale_17015 [Volvox reticuliferus]GIM12935.1 hypothetical protein Vretimale_16175 [Volvox reticuliferus]
MAEISYGGSGQGAVDYARQQPPYQRNRVDSERWAQIAADNAVMAKKLLDVRREPPASFHAPRGYQSVRGGQRRRQERAGKAQSDMADTLHYVPPTPWPPTEPAHQTVRQSKAQREIDIANGHMASKLRETYRHHGDSLLEKHKLGRGFDCNDRWAQRTAIYDNDAAKVTAAINRGVRVLDVEQVSVPKSLGIAHCSGCGARCFYAADGVKLMRCRACKAAWYCSEACAKLDFQSHKAICKYTTTGHWTPGGIRPAEDCWVSNAAMAEIRNDLRRRAAAALAQRTPSASPSVDSNPSTPSPRRRQQLQDTEAVPPHQRRRRLPPAPGRPASASGAVSSPHLRRSLAGSVTGVAEVHADALGGEVETLYSLEAKYRQLRERELVAERELADVEYRANHGLDGPRPCMYVMKRFAEPSEASAGGGSRRPASAGPRLRSGGGGGGGMGDEQRRKGQKKPAWQDTASFL